MLFKSTKTIKIIENETKLNAKTELIVASQRIESQKVLDLTNTEQLQKYGLLDFVNSAVKSNEYFDGQIIGNVARKQGFEVIIAPSHFGSGGVNVIVLK